MEETVKEPTIIQKINETNWWETAPYIFFFLSLSIFQEFLASIYPNQTGLFEDSFFWEEGQTDPLQISRKTYPISIQLYKIVKKSI